LGRKLSFDKCIFIHILGILSSAGIFGPAVAFAQGGLFSRLYVTLEGKYRVGQTIY
jgi:hypothetical protein